MHFLNCRFNRLVKERKVNGLVPRMPVFQNNFEKSLNYLNIVKSEDFLRLLIAKEFQEETVFQDCWIFCFWKRISQQAHETSRKCGYAKDYMSFVLYVLLGAVYHHILLSDILIFCNM